jgi:hypothetical protein
MTTQTIPSCDLQPDLVPQIKKDILEEVYKASKFPQSGFLRDMVKPLLEKPINHFSSLIADLDGIIHRSGFVSAAQYALPRLTHDAVSTGNENIPITGPVIIASNHPGTYDAFTIISQLPRDDIKLIVSGIPFFRNLPNASSHFIFSTLDTNVRTSVIRKSICHLQEGGTLLIFPSGRIDPDPAVLPGAPDGLRRWSRSIEVFLKKVPQSKLVLTITSGVLSKDFTHSFFASLFRNDHERRRIMEFRQVIWQMLHRTPLSLNPKVSFAAPISALEALSENYLEENNFINMKTQQLLDYHMNLFYPNL